MTLPSLFNQAMNRWRWGNDPFFNRFFSEPRLWNIDAAEDTYLPACDFKETDKEYNLKMDLPGIKKQDIHIGLSNGVLSIEAESTQSSEDKKEGKVIRQERQYGKFIRQFYLGDGVKDNEVLAKFKDGVLSLTIPKHEQHKPEVRQIAIE